jgi:hypothetical protein
MSNHPVRDIFVLPIKKWAKFIMTLRTADKSWGK